MISDGKRLNESGLNVVRPEITDVELEKLVSEGRIQMPGAAQAMDTVPTPTSVDTKINVRGELEPGKAGNFADGIIGATAIENGSVLVTNDKKLTRAVEAVGGQVVTPAELLGRKP